MLNFSRFMNDESGVTAIEYALTAGILGVGTIAVLSNIRSTLQSTFNSVSSNLSSGAK